MIIAVPFHTFVIEGTQHNVYHVDLNTGLPKHEHIYAHATVCHAGKLKVTKENFELIMDKTTQPVLLKENEWHELEALEDGTVFENIFKEGAY